VKTYAISNGGHIKIGRTSDVEKRIANLQCASPYRLELVCVADGDIEKRAHEHLEREGCHRGVGEWFEDTRKVRDELWQLGFVAVGAYEENHRDGESQKQFCLGWDHGWMAGIKHWNDAMSVLNDGVEEHW
jgi:hypothetical protein